MRRRLGNVGLTLLLAVFMFIPISAAFILSAPAGADPGVSARADVYAAQHFRAVCANLALLPNVESVEQVVMRAVRDGLTAQESGEAVTVAIVIGCPEYGYLLDEFVDKWAPDVDPAPITAGIGGVIR